MKGALSFVRRAASPRTCDNQRYVFDVLPLFYSLSDFKEGHSATWQWVSTEDDAGLN
jgi:hypothetical protein